MKLSQVYRCQKCTAEIDTTTYKAGRVPELCKACRAEKDRIERKLINKISYLRRVES